MPRPKTELDTIISKSRPENNTYDSKNIIKLYNLAEEYLDKKLSEKAILPYQAEAQTIVKNLSYLIKKLSNLNKQFSNKDSHYFQATGMFFPTKTYFLLMDIKAQEIPETIEKLNEKLSIIKEKDTYFDKIANEIYQSIVLEVLPNKALDYKPIILAQGRVIVQESNKSKVNIYNITTNSYDREDFYIKLNRETDKTFSSIEQALNDEESIPTNTMSIVIVRNYNNYPFKNSFFPILEDKYTDGLKSEQVNNFS